MYWKSKLEVEGKYLVTALCNNASFSFSEVYKGKWLGTTVAIKRFLLNQTSSDEILNDFEKETSLMARLRQ